MTVAAVCAAVDVAEINREQNAIGVRVIKNTIRIGDRFDYLVTHKEYSDWSMSNYKVLLSPPKIKDALKAVSLRVTKIAAYRQEWEEIDEGWTCYLYLDSYIEDCVLNNILIASTRPALP